MTLRKFECKIEKGKPYSQQLGRKVGRGAGHIHTAEAQLEAWDSRGRRSERVINSKRISIYGSTKDQERAKQLIDKLAPVLTGDEGKDRIIIQKGIDAWHLPSTASILYDGNTVYSYNKIVRDFARALTSPPSPESEYGGGEWDMTKGLYDFLSLSTGSIAHFNKYGWIGTYPTKEALVGYLHRNEFGQDIVSYQPGWATDRIKIAKELIRIGDAYMDGK